MPNTTSDTPPAAPPARYTHAVPCLAYADAPAAIAWLAGVLGAEARHVYPGPGGTVAHAELWFGSACVMLGSRKEDGPMQGAGRSVVYLAAEDARAVDALHTRAVAAGARVVTPPRATDYGAHEFACLDPEGNAWSVGTYAPA